MANRRDLVSFLEMRTSRSNSKNNAESASVTDQRAAAAVRIGQWRRASERSDRATRTAVVKYSEI